MSEGMSCRRQAVLGLASEAGDCGRSRCDCRRGGGRRLGISDVARVSAVGNSAKATAWPVRSVQSAEPLSTVAR